MSGREWQSIPRSHEPGGYVPKAGDRLRVTIEAVVADPISDYGFQARNHAGSRSHTIYLNQDDVVGIEVERRSLQEPTGLGAVVENERGHKYVRVADPIDGWMADKQWQRIGGEINAVRNFGWREIGAVRVLSDGVQP